MSGVEEKRTKGDYNSTFIAYQQCELRKSQGALKIKANYRASIHVREATSKNEQRMLFSVLKLCKTTLNTHEKGLTVNKNTNFHQKMLVLSTSLVLPST